MADARQRAALAEGAAAEAGTRLQAAGRQLEMLEAAHKQEKAQWDSWKAHVLERVGQDRSSAQQEQGRLTLTLNRTRTRTRTLPEP